MVVLEELEHILMECDLDLVFFKQGHTLGICRLELAHWGRLVFLLGVRTVPEVGYLLSRLIATNVPLSSSHEIVHWLVIPLIVEPTLSQRGGFPGDRRDIAPILPEEALDSDVVHRRANVINRSWL